MFKAWMGWYSRSCLPEPSVEYRIKKWIICLPTGRQVRLLIEIGLPKLLMKAAQMLMFILAQFMLAVRCAVLFSGLLRVLVQGMFYYVFCIGINILIIIKSMYCVKLNIDYLLFYSLHFLHG